jgi:hypothetical protein
MSPLKHIGRFAARQSLATALGLVILATAAWAITQTVNSTIQPVIGVSGGTPVPVVESASASSGIPPTASSALESSHVLKASAGNLSSLSVTIGTTSGYLMVFDAASAPADGAVTPKYAWPVTSNGTNSALGISWTVPAQFLTGVTVVFSSTGPLTKTASATAFFSGQVQ